MKATSEPETKFPVSNIQINSKTLNGHTADKSRYADIVGDIVQTRSAPTFKPGDGVPDLIPRMHDHATGAGAVVDAKGCLLGLVTEREIIRRIFHRPPETIDPLEAGNLGRNQNARSLTAWDVMIPGPDTLHIKDKVEDAHDVITYFGYRYMPVVDSARRFAGIVDERELYRHVRAKDKALMESQSQLLAYFTHHEPYGGAGGFSM